METRDCFPWVVWALGIIQPAVWTGCFPNTSVAWAETEGISVDVWKSSLNCRSNLSFPKSQSHVDLAREDRSAQRRHTLTWKGLPNRKLGKSAVQRWCYFMACILLLFFLVCKAAGSLFPGATFITTSLSWANPSALSIFTTIHILSPSLLLSLCFLLS